MFARWRDESIHAVITSVALRCPSAMFSPAARALYCTAANRALSVGYGWSGSSWSMCPAFTI
jgi:hypothetical protein